MAGENSSGNTAFEDFMLAFFAILLVGQMFQRGPEILAERYGVGVEENSYLVAGVGLDADTPLGTKVNTVNGTSFFSEAGGTEAEGNFPPGTSLELVGGPETIDGERWWEVEDPETGKRGWVQEKSLVREGVGGLGVGTSIGSKAQVLLDTNVWSEPGSLVKAGFVKMGDFGELIKGPKKKNGSRWWFFDKDDSDDDGWLPEAALKLASANELKEGSNVYGVRTTDIYEKAGSGRVVGLLEKDEKAEIIGGPVHVGGEMWWLIETEEGEQGWVPEDSVEGAGIKSWFKKLFAIIMIIGTLITLVLLSGIVYVTIRTNQIRAKEAQRLKSAIPEKVEPRKNERWENIQKLISSQNPNDWRLAIIEADIILDEVITRMGYHGESLGDKLKQVSKGNMETLDSAWEAHKVRNNIAHSGSDFILTQREAKRVIDLYTQVFVELKSL